MLAKAYHVKNGLSLQIFWVRVCRLMELICTNCKRDSRKKFTSPEFCVPFTQNLNHVN